MASTEACSIYVKYFHLMSWLSIIRASALALEAWDGAMFKALQSCQLGPDMRHLLNNVKLGEMSVPSRVFTPFVRVGLLGIDQCAGHKQGGNAGKPFIPASELKYHSQSVIRPRHKLAITGNSLTKQQ